jgi:hypothetical protein
MNNALTFVIPVRHPANAKNWLKLKQNLTQTIKSIANQKSDRWKTIIVANYGSDLPILPKGFEVAWVNFLPNQLHEQGNVDKEEFYEAFRADKGRRVLVGMLHAGNMGHVMIVDDDDLVNRNLTSFVEQNPTANGWYIRDGYVWTDGGKLLYEYSDFSKLCGTSHIIRADLYCLPKCIEAAEEVYIRKTLGSHVFFHDQLINSGASLAPLPFRGAIYRIGHAGAHSGSAAILKEYFYHRYLLKRPKELCRRILRLRPKNARIRRDFFGS